MREQHRKKQEYKAQGHGEYTEIKEDEFLTTVHLLCCVLFILYVEKSDP